MKTSVKWIVWILGLGIAAAVAILGIEQNYRYGAWLDGQGLAAHQLVIFNLPLAFGAGMTLAALNALKVILPILVKEIASWFLKLVASLVFFCLAVLSIWNTFSLTTLTRAERTSSEMRQAQRVSDLRTAHAAQTMRLKALGEPRPVDQVNADLAAERQSKSWGRSKGCTDATSGDSRLFCTTYNRIQGELASATEAASIRTKVEVLRVAIANVDHVGVINPELAMVQRLTNFDGETAGAVRALVFAIVFELAEAFGLVLVWACRPNAVAALRERAAKTIHGSSAASVVEGCQTFPTGNNNYIAMQPPRRRREGVPDRVSSTKSLTIKTPCFRVVEGLSTTLQPRSGGLSEPAFAKKHHAADEAPAVERHADTLRVVGSSVALYVDARLKASPGAAIQAADLWEDYLAWCELSKQVPVTQTRFGRELPSRGISKIKAGGFMWYQDVRLSA